MKRGSDKAPAVITFEVVHGLIRRAMDTVGGKDTRPFERLEAYEDVKGHCRTLVSLSRINPYVRAQALPVAEALLGEYCKGKIRGRRKTEATRALGDLVTKLGGTVPAEIGAQLEAAY